MGSLPTPEGGGEGGGAKACRGTSTMGRRSVGLGESLLVRPACAPAHAACLLACSKRTLAQELRVDLPTCMPILPTCLLGLPA